VAARVVVASTGCSRAARSWLAALALGALMLACAPVPTPTPTAPIPATPDEALISRSIAAAEAQLKIRASLPTGLPVGARVTRVAVIGDKPPTLDLEYLIGGQRVLLRQRPAQSDAQFPPEAAEVTIAGGTARALVRVDERGQLVKSEVYWTRDGMDYALAGALPIEQMATLAATVSRPGS
jgi:hypothetical protein